MSGRPRRAGRVDYRLLAASLDIDADGFQVLPSSERMGVQSAAVKTEQRSTSGASAAAAPSPRVRANLAARAKVRAAEESAEAAAVASGSSAAAPRTRWDRIKGQVRSQLQRVRFSTAMLDAYERDGWRRANREKMRPEGELDKARRTIIRAKVKIRATLRDLWTGNGADAERALDPAHFDESGIDADSIFCATCGGFDPDGEDNDILLCDLAGCDKAFHQKCLDPAVPTEVLQEDPEGDWFCHRCSCLLVCLNMVNDEFETDFDSWEEVFPDADASSPRGGNRGAAAAEESGDQLSPEGKHRLRRSKRRRVQRSERRCDGGGDDVSDDESNWGSDSDPEDWGAAAADDDDSADSDSSSSSESDDDESGSDNPSKLIISGKRRRTKVDYVALAAEMYGDASDSDEEGQSFTDRSRLTEEESRQGLLSSELGGDTDERRTTLANTT